MRLMLTRAILLGLTGAIIFFALGIMGCDGEIKTHPPLDKRIKSVEDELQRLERTQQDEGQTGSHSARTNNAEY
jgi:hypothetical protein